MTNPSLRLRLLTIATLALGSLTGCGVTGGTTARKVAPTPETWTAGPWMYKPARFPDRGQELVFTPFTETRTHHSWERRGSRQLVRFTARSATQPTGDFQLAPAEGGSLVITGTYRMTGDSFVRQDSEKDFYRGLAWIWTDDRLTLAKSDVSTIKAYGGGTLTPIEESPLFDALRRGDRAVLLAEPALATKAISERDQLGRSLLYRAAQLDDQGTVALLLAKGVPADLRNAPPFERTPLAAAIRLSRLEVMDQLLAAGADPNIADAFGARPLHIAGEGCGAYRQMIRQLLAAGADPELTNKAGETPRKRLVRAGASGFLPLLDQEIAASRQTPLAE